MPGTAHVLRVSLHFPIMEVKASPKSSQMEAKGIVLSQLRYPVTVLRKAVAPLRRSNTKARGDEQKSSQACICGTSLQQVADPQGSEYRCGAIRSSDEGSVMELERRDCVVLLLHKNNPKGEDSVGKSKVV